MGIQPTPTPQPFGRPIRVWIFYPIIRLNACAGQLSLVGLVECQKWRDLQDSSREKKPSICWKSTPAVSWFAEPSGTTLQLWLTEPKRIHPRPCCQGFETKVGSSAGRTRCLADTNEQHGEGNNWGCGSGRNKFVSLLTS